MRFSAIFPALMLAGAFAAASAQQIALIQQPGQATTKSSAANQYIILRAQPCSVDMHAIQGSSSQILRAQNGQSTPMMRPSLTLKPHDGRQIVSATVTAHGYSAQPGSMDLVAQAVLQPPKPHSREIAKTLTIKFHATENGGFTAELKLPGFSAVTMIDLNSVTYSDGSTWQMAAQNQCSVAPDPLLLIAAH